MITSKIRVSLEEDISTMDKILKVHYWWNQSNCAIFRLREYQNTQIGKQQFLEQVRDELIRLWINEPDVDSVIYKIISPPTILPKINVQPDNSIYYSLFRTLLSIPIIPSEVYDAIRITKNNMERQKKVLDLKKESEDERKEYERKYGTLIDKFTSYIK